MFRDLDVNWWDPLERGHETLLSVNDVKVRRAESDGGLARCHIAGRSNCMNPR